LPRNDTQSLSPEQAQRIAEECYSEVLAYCRRHAPAGHEADDLAQETFLRFVRAGSYREHGKPIAYLMRTARSVCIDASRVRRFETVTLDFDVADNQDSDWDPLLEEALAKLPSEQREVVELRFSSDLEINEIAQALGISRFSVRRRIQSALKFLEGAMKDGDLDG